MDKETTQEEQESKQQVEQEPEEESVSVTVDLPCLSGEGKPLKPGGK
jgi:hypothetical protein